MPLPRFDGTLCTDVPAYRRIVPFLMRGRNESAVYFEQTIDLTRTLPFIAEWNASHPREQRITFFHVLLGALPRLLAERPRLNRFVSGERIYQRNGVHVSFAAKKKMDDEAPLQVVKLRFEATEPFGGHFAVRGLAAVLVDDVEQDEAGIHGWFLAGHEPCSFLWSLAPPAGERALGMPAQSRAWTPTGAPGRREANKKQWGTRCGVPHPMSSPHEAATKCQLRRP